MIFPDQSFQCQQVAPEQMDEMWAQGWRHFGTAFFRYAVAFHDGRLFSVIPLRIDLTRFAPSRSQKRVIARNRDLQVVIRDTRLDREKETLFARHRERFNFNVPDSLYDFLSARPATVPCHNQEICVYAGDRLIAVSFLDCGRTATSGVYAMFDPVESPRSPGILLILESIRYARKLGCRYYYPGYAYREPSVYDYKKRFEGLEYLAWESGWRSYTREVDRDEFEFDFNTRS